jgi:hypothetical protein
MPRRFLVLLGAAMTACSAGSHDTPVQQDAAASRMITCPTSLSTFCADPRGTSFATTCPATLEAALRDPLFCRDYRFPLFAFQSRCDSFTMLSVFSADHGEQYFYDTAGRLIGVTHFVGPDITCLGGAPGFAIPLDARCEQRTPVPTCDADGGASPASVETEADSRASL